MNYSNYRSYGDLTQAILGFTEYVRAHDLVVGLRESEEAIRVATLGLIARKDIFKFALKSIFCCSKDNSELFDHLFTDYWGQEKIAVKEKVWFYNSNVLKKAKSSLVLLGKDTGPQMESEEEGKNVTGSNKMEKLRKTDFSKVAEMDSEYLDALAENLWKQMSKRLRKKLKNSHTKGRIDIRQTLRTNIDSGGSLAKLEFKRKTNYKRKLVVLLDVSGSMDKYSFYLLRFILALREHFQKVEAFIFSTKLIRITEYLKMKNLERVLSYLTVSADNWSGGTKIGESLQSFNDHYAKGTLNGRSITIVLSDGLDTGEPSLLSAELHKIKLRTKKLIWLNPLKGMDGYEPTAKGMNAALPEINVFRSAHNLDSLLELENFLADV